MANFLARLFGLPIPDRTEESNRPILPTPDTGPVRPNASAQSETQAEPALKNWSHPFKDKRDPLLQLTHLAKAAAGSYPVGRSGLWHGGIHFDGGTAGTLDQSSVHCLADGEVVAYRIDEQSPTTGFFVNKITVQKPFSRNFVLVRHRLQAPKIDGSPDTPPSLTFFSLYMHLQDWAVYRDDPAITRPPFWPEAAIRRVKQDVHDMRSSHPGQEGLNVRNADRQGKVLDLLPKGAEVVVSGQGAFRKLENTIGPASLLNAEGQLLGYVSTYYLESMPSGEYRVKSDNPVKVMAEADYHSTTIGTLPNGTEVTLSGEGRYRKLERINQYVWFKSLQGSLEPEAHDQIVVLEKPVPIKAGDLIGHIGLYQDCYAERPEQKLHLEVFSGNDVTSFIAASRAWAQRLPASSKTWLKFAKGTAVVTHQERFNTKQPPRLDAPHALSDADLLVPKSLLDGLPPEKKIKIAATPGRKAYNWYRLDGLLHGSDNTLLNGWVREEVSVTPWFSPWEWEGYDVIFNFDVPRKFLASYLRAVNQLSEAQLEQYGKLADDVDNGPLMSRLHAIIDRDRNGKMTGDEIQTAFNLPAHAQAISQLIVDYASEWCYSSRTWDPFDEMLGHSGSTPHLNWLAEKERIKQLSWWDEVAVKVGLESWPKVCHFHPVGLVGQFLTTHPLAITHAQLKQIFPAADDGDIEVVLNEINGRLIEFKLDTRLRQRHFFAQIKGEVGPAMKGVSESWEYSPAALKSFSVYYRNHPTEAETDGYLKDASGRIVRRANQQEIGRKHFQKLNGNRSSNPDDGYNFRGRGLIQITGFEKYNGFMRDYPKYWQGSAPRTVAEPDLINEMPNAIRSAVWFWLYKTPYSNDKGNGLGDVAGVTYKVNGGYTGLAEREAAYKEIQEVLK